MNCLADNKAQFAASVNRNECSLNYFVSKNDTDVAQYTFKAHQQLFKFLAEMLLREYVIEC